MPRKNLKAQLIRLGHQNPALRKHITPVIDTLQDDRRGKQANVAREVGGYETLISLHYQQIEEIGRDNNLGSFVGLIPQDRMSPPRALLVFTDGYAGIGLDQLERDEFGDEYLNLISVGTLYT